MSDAYLYDPAAIGDQPQANFQPKPPVAADGAGLPPAYQPPLDGGVTSQTGPSDAARAAFWEKMQAGLKSGAISQQQFDMIAQRLGYTPQQQQQTAAVMAQKTPATGVAQPNYSGPGAVGAQLGQSFGDAIGKTATGIKRRMDAPGAPLDISPEGPGGPDPEPSPQWNQ